MQLEEVPVVRGVVGLGILVHARQQPPPYAPRERGPPAGGHRDQRGDEKADRDPHHCRRQLHASKDRGRVWGVASQFVLGLRTASPNDDGRCVRQLPERTPPQKFSFGGLY